MQRITHTATWTPFRTPILAISDFLKFGFNPEKGEKKCQPYAL